LLSSKTLTPISIRENTIDRLQEGQSAGWADKAVMEYDDPFPAPHAGPRGTDAAEHRIVFHEAALIRIAVTAIAFVE